MMYFLRGIDHQGSEVYYTGRAGDGWVSTDRRETFYWRSQEGATARAKEFNRHAGVHGVWFLALATAESEG